MKYERKFTDPFAFDVYKIQRAAGEDLKRLIADRLANYSDDLLNSSTVRQYWLEKTFQRSTMYTIHIRDKLVPYILTFDRVRIQRYITLCGIQVGHYELNHHQPDQDNQKDIMDYEEPTCVGCILMQLDPEVREAHE